MFRKFFGKYGRCIGCKISKIRCRPFAQPWVLQYRVASCNLHRLVRRTTSVSMNFFNDTPYCADWYLSKRFGNVSHASILLFLWFQFEVGITPRGWRHAHDSSWPALLPLHLVRL